MKQSKSFEPVKTLSVLQSFSTKPAEKGSNLRMRLDVLLQVRFDLKQLQGENSVKRYLCSPFPARST
jgi:hypothetical protein